MSAEVNKKWQDILQFVREGFNKKPDLDALLFLIGVRELGELPDKKFSKEQKVDLMHIATCKVLSYSGYYELEGTDKDGWPHWVNKLPLPNLSTLEQETLLRHHIIAYFENEEILN